MPGVPSNKACDRCKKRHIKCDEARPGCQRCGIAGVVCPGYSQDRKFIDQGATVRRRYAPYQRDETKSQSSVGRTAHESPQGENTMALPSPDQGTQDGRETRIQSSLFVSPWTDGQMSLSSSEPLPPNNENLASFESAEPIGSTASYSGFTTSASFPNTQNTSGDLPDTTGFSFANPFDNFNAMQSPKLYGSNLESQPSLTSTIGSEFPFMATGSSYTASQNTNPFGDLYSEFEINSEREIAFLSRHYVESIAPWLDLHNSEKFFAQKVLRRSSRAPFLQNSVLAIAAKNLARVNGTKSPRNATSKPAASETYPNVTGVNWEFKASNYFYQALFNMRQLVLGQGVEFQQFDTTASPIHMLCNDLQVEVTSDSTGPAILLPTFVSNIDEIYPGLVILTIFDIIDKPGTEWETRFRGLGALLQCVLSPPGPRTRTSTPSHAIRASFWNLAYLDCFASYANRRRSRVDAYNFNIFRAAGISIDNLGVLDLHKMNNLSPAVSSSQPDDTFLCGITFILLKLMNFIGEFKEIQEAASNASTPVPDFLTNASVPQSSGLAVKWQQLMQEVDSWYNSLPDSFQPYIRLENPHDVLSATSTSSQPLGLPFPEIVFSSATHASTIALYNFARIILLLNRPFDSQNTARDRLVEYREVTKQVDSCTREIAGIAMGRTAAVVQIHLVHPLYVVGLCDDRPEARRKVIELLQAIRTDFGWDTEYTITRLRSIWNKS